MSERHERYLEELRAAYEPIRDFAGAEIAQIDALAEQWEATRDPAWGAFRENPVTRRLLSAARATFRASKMALANDDGTMAQVERLRLHTSAMWAQWYVRALGGDPKAERERVEREIESFAEGAGVIHSAPARGS